MAGDLFVKAQGEETLETFVSRMVKLLELGSVERRTSSSYVDDEYYKSVALGIVVKLSRADEVDLEGYDFWICLRPLETWIENPTFVDGLADLLARRLTVAGEQVVRMPDAEKINGRKIFYTINEDAPHRSKERIIMTDG